MNEILEKLKKEYPKSKYYLNFSNPLELMVASILSAQVRDIIVNNYTKELFKKFKTIKDYAKTDEKDILKYVSKINFAKNKSSNIKKSCQLLLEKNQVPKNMEQLVKLPGIGRKTANVILQNGFNIIEGIIVDTHVIRLSYRFGWTNQKNPEKQEKDLMKKIEKKHWKKLPHLLKEHGRLICTIIPKCSKCFLNKLCPKNGVTKKF